MEHAREPVLKMGPHLQAFPLQRQHVSSQLVKVLKCQAHLKQVEGQQVLGATLRRHNVEVVGGRVHVDKGGGAVGAGGGSMTAMRGGVGATARGGTVEVSGQLLGDDLDLGCPLNQWAKFLGDLEMFRMCCMKESFYILVWVLIASVKQWLIVYAVANWLLLRLYYAHKMLSVCYITKKLHYVHCQCLAYNVEIQEI